MKINTELTNKEIEEALTGDLDVLWNVFESIEGDGEFDKKYNEVRYGLNVHFDIRSIIEGDYEKKVAFGAVVIERKIKIDITDFRNEMGERKRIMKDIVRSLYEGSFDNQEEEEIHGY